MTHKDTSCFHTGLCADILEPNTLASPLLPDPADELGVCSLLLFPLACVLVLSLPFTRPLSLLLIAPSAESAFDCRWWPALAMEESAVDEEVRERFVATPLTSLSASSVGSRETNSFCSNWTTT